MWLIVEESSIIVFVIENCKELIKNIFGLTHHEHHENFVQTVNNVFEVDKTEMSKIIVEHETEGSVEGAEALKFLNLNHLCLQRTLLENVQK